MGGLCNHSRIDMNKTVETIELLSPAPGTRRSLRVHRYGIPGAAPKVYIQAALHADEHPGLLVAQHLIALLDRAAADGRVRGEIVVVPVANPIGLSQHLNGHQPGRYDFETGGNFNRDFPDLAPELIERLRGRLGSERAANRERVRTVLRELATALVPEREADDLKIRLLGLAIDADIVLDLHCDFAALMHLYASRHHRELAEALGRELGAAVLMLEEEAGGRPFDESCAGPWWKLAAALGPETALDAACFAATVELRGQADVDDALAADDAERLLRFLARQGALAGEPEPAGHATMLTVPLEGVDVVRAPRAGIVAYRKRLGDRVERGEIVAEIVDLEAADPVHGRTPVVSRASGLLFTSADRKLARPGQQLCKVAGREPLEYRKPGKLLAD